jgi:hypothetical protein
MGRNGRSVSTNYGPVCVLVASSNSGRFALNEAEGFDLTCGQVISVLLGGQWVDGCVEHTHGLYPQERTFEEIMRKTPLRYLGGYFFVAHDGNICGLCVGMQVRLIG